MEVGGATVPVVEVTETFFYVAAAITAWLVAQGLKYVIASFKGKRVSSPRQLYLSGGMPSAHSATTVALVVAIGGIEGVNSSVFAVALLMSAVVMYDAIMVRRSSGEQGESLTALIKEQKSKVRLPRVAKGHTPVEVLAGAALGVIIGLVVIFIQNQV